MIYFDYAATCPLNKKAAEVYVKVATEVYGNESSLHDIGWHAKSLLEHCREQMAHILSVDTTGVFFTSGGSEGNFLAIEALLSAKKSEGKHIITSIAEHASVHGVMERLRNDGYEITFLPYDQNGRVNIQLLKEVLRKDTVLISIQHSNSELGIIQPISEISALCKQHNILLHSDCVHSFGKVDLTNMNQFVDSLTISGHKFYGPKGIGVVYLNPKLNWQPYFPNAVHELGFKPGTVNVPAIAAMVTAAQDTVDHLSQLQIMFNEYREQFIKELAPLQDKWCIHENKEGFQLPATIGMRILGIEGQYVMLECNRHGLAIATGSACHTSLQAPTGSMTALGIETKSAKEFIRISFGMHTTKEDITKLTRRLKMIIEENTI